MGKKTIAIDDPAVTREHAVKVLGRAGHEIVAAQAPVPMTKQIVGAS